MTMTSPPASARKPLARSARRTGRLGRSERIAGLAMAAPAVALLAWWYAWPILQSVILSFQRVGKYDFADREFIGLQNYAELLADPAFLSSVRITGVFVLVVVPVQTVIALVIAALLQGVQAGRSALRTSYFVPYMISTVAVTTIFMQLFVKGGPVSGVVALLGGPDVTWYAEPDTALWFLMVVYVYMSLGLYIVILMGGLEGVPAELYEAASVDGAGALRRFWSVTVPGIRPFLVFVIVTGVIQAIQVFDQAYVISGGTVLGSPAGATSTIVIFIYQQAFRLNAIGYASAATVLLLAAVVIAGVISRRFSKGDG
ncbi:MAG: sugar ABC transporter permease [Protaetiibacter sp.]